MLFEERDDAVAEESACLLRESQASCAIHLIQQKVMKVRVKVVSGVQLMYECYARGSHLRRYHVSFEERVGVLAEERA